VTTAATASRRRYARAFALGALVAGFVCYWMVTSGTFDPGHRVPYSGNFYDVQAHRILDGHLSMPESVLGIEGYEHDGNWYMYFGPAPALLRLPVAAVTDSLDGQTGIVSMALAFVVLMFSLGRLSWRVRRWARRDGEVEVDVDGREQVLAGVTALALGVGTTVVFLGVGPYVYHEASLWGLALAFAAFEAILAWIEHPRTSLIVAAGVLTLLSLLSRLAMGLAPTAALGLLALAIVVARLWPRARGAVARVGVASDGLGWSVAAALAAAALVPLALYAAVNVAKFGTLFSLPFEHQAVNAVVPERKAILAANHGTLFSVKALPTNLWQYVRPDAFRVDGAWPWVRLPTWRPTVFGDLRYDMLDHTSSVTAAMPALLVLAIGGVVAMVRAPARTARTSLASLDLPVLGAVAAAVPSLVFLYITERYTADFLPLLVLAALAGLHAFLVWARAPASRRGWVVATSIGLGLLVAWGCLANVSIARDYQIAREQLTTFRAPGG
jgi:hypothetical protein